MTTSSSKGFNIHVDPNLLSAPSPLPLHTIAEDAAVRTGKNVQTYTSNITFSFLINETPIHSRFASLYGRLLTHDKSFQILPAAVESKLNPITSAANIPSDPDQFAQFFSGMTQNNKSIQFYAKTTSSLRVNQLKHSKGMFEHLRKWGIYMKYNQIASSQVKAVGWLYLKHPEADSRSELKHTLTGMTGGFDDFQLNSRDIFLDRGSKIRTRGWVMEMDQTVSETHFGKILETCHLGAQICIVPFMDPSAWDNTGAAETFIVKHNAMLRASQIINVNGLQGLEEITEDADGNISTFRECLLNQIDDQGKKVFHSVAQVNSKRVCFLTSQEMYHTGVRYIDEMIDDYLPGLDEDVRAKHTFDQKDPIRVGKKAIPKTISTYTSYLKDFSHGLSETSKHELSAPPQRRLRGQRSYADATTATTTASSTGTSNTTAIDLSSTASSTSNDSHSQGSLWTDFDIKMAHVTAELTALQNKITKGQESLIAQKQETADRMKKLEDSIIKVYDDLNTIAKNQDIFQKNQNDTNTEIGKITGMLTTLLAAQASQKPVGTTKPAPSSPFRKKQCTSSALAIEEPVKVVEPGEDVTMEEEECS
jgi:hypothetical protein